MSARALHGDFHVFHHEKLLGSFIKNLWFPSRNDQHGESTLKELLDIEVEMLTTHDHIALCAQISHITVEGTLYGQWVECDLLMHDEQVIAISCGNRWDPIEAFPVTNLNQSKAA